MRSRVGRRVNHDNIWKQCSTRRGGLVGHRNIFNQFADAHSVVGRLDNSLAR